MATTARPDDRTRPHRSEPTAPAQDAPARLANDDARLADEQRRGREDRPRPSEEAPTAADIKGKTAWRAAGAAIGRWPG